MADIKLFVCCHQPTEVPKHSLLVPIQVGAALSDFHFPGFLQDDTGDNISHKNRSYCELTAQYWAWKNIDADYYGFFHYRRYLYPDRNAQYPYRVEEKPALELLNRMGYDTYLNLIPQYDLILPKGENMHITVRKHYTNAQFHHESDLTILEEIAKRQTPQYTKAIEKYFSQTICYFGNIYIMSRPIFNRYCAWLFPILEQFDQWADVTNRLPQEQRVDGYLAERLFGGFYYKVKNEVFRTLELPRVDFIPENNKRWSRKLLTATLLPGTKRRAIMKYLCKG